jgi:hypothetical protein
MTQGVPFVSKRKQMCGVLSKISQFDLRLERILRLTQTEIIIKKNTSVWTIPGRLNLNPLTVAARSVAV